MMGAIYAVAITAIMHSACVDIDEQVRYEQLAAIEESRQEAASYEKAEPYQEWYESGVTAYYTPAWTTPTDGLNAFSGVNYHDGRTETFYSSNVLYHYRTGEWWLDDEGFYRDADGYYVVAASDMEQGETFTGSKGECKVYDCGCADGVTDYYVNW